MTKFFKFRRLLALLISVIAMFVATMSSSLCLFWAFEEPKMPKSLYKFD